MASWMVFLTVFVLEGVAGLSSDGEALLGFKEGVTLDPQSALQGWRSSDATPCRWSGVACTTGDRVVSVALSRRELTGTISPRLADLVFLAALDLSGNRFSGAIPADLGNLTSLKAQLNLSHNVLSGAIPPSLANLQRVPLDVSYNLLAGAIPGAAYFQSQGPPAYVGNAALCGSPLKVNCASPSSSPSSSARKRRLSTASILGIGFSCALLLVMATVVVTRKTSSRSGCLCSWRESVVPADQLVQLSGALSFDLEELLRASAYVLGKSAASGIVYKAVLDESTAVAVRRLGEGGEHKHKEFVAEAKAIARVSQLHPNVITLHSCSWSVDEKLLVYDYLPGGSLESALHGDSKSSLSLEARLRIARGAAQGIAHIHECKHVHGDVKPSNILLDAFLDARVSDFGLQRLLQPEPPRASSVSPAPGFLTGVYQAPDAPRPSQTSDVYSFGVVLLELLTGRSPFKQLAAGQHNLVSWTRFALHHNEDLFDPALREDDHDHDHDRKMTETLQVALACIAVNPDSRPKMKQVAEFFHHLTKRS